MPRNALVDHCQQWQKKLTDLLNENARTEMNRRDVRLGLLGLTGVLGWDVSTRGLYTRC